jgi:ABC-type antimicrobial peptide transport system permease subunit
MHLTDPIGKSVKLWGNDYEIIGVVSDFHFESLFQPVKPCFFKLSDDNHKIAVKILSGTERETLSRLEKLYQSFNPGIPFDFKFLDDEYEALYLSEQRVADLSLYFAGIAILISCLGLFGLAAFTAERRMKEIGIRKILGSSEFGIVYLLSSDFTKMVLIAIVIVLPVSYFIAREWLGSFAYRIELEWWYFIGAGLAALCIAWLTVGVQAVKAASSNPTQCLRSE